MIRLSAPVTLSPDTESRTIEGMAVHFDQVIQASTGPVMFLAGSLPTEGTPPKLLRDHDPSQPLGLVTERWDTPDGVAFRAKISATAAGDEALTLAADGVLDSVSVGVQPVDFIRQDGVMVVAAGAWMELSLLPWGADPNAKISRVAASPADEECNTPTPNPSEEEPMSESVEAAPAPVVATAPIHAAPARKVTASDYIAAAITGDFTPAIRAVAAQDALADVPGVVPEPLIGEVWDTLTEERPITSALGTFAMPQAGETFYRRKVTQHTSVGLQATEFAELSSQKMTIARIQVDKKTYGGYVDVSEQSASWADVALLDMIIRDMAREYARATEIAVATEIAGGASAATATVTSWLDGDEVIEDLYAAAAEIKAATNLMPTHLIVSTNIWAQIGAAKDSGGNRIFPYLAPSNAAGTLNGATSTTGNPLGLQLIVSDDIVVGPATKAAIMLNSRVVEVYEDRRGAIRVDQPATLSTRLAFRGFLGIADIDLANGALNLA